MAPQEVIKQYGAEILRLWVAAQDYREDLRISPAILAHLIDSYRKIRNTCRFMLSNLYDFDPAVNRVPYERLPELDRWALMQLDHLIERVRRAYDDFEFHVIFHELNDFCSVQMSATYFDVLKDRLYTFGKNSTPRRGSQVCSIRYSDWCDTVDGAHIGLHLRRDLAGDSRNTTRGRKRSSRAAAEARLGAAGFCAGKALGAAARRARRSPSRAQVQRREKIIGAPLEAKVIVRGQSREV